MLLQLPWEILRKLAIATILLMLLLLPHQTDAFANNLIETSIGCMTELDSSEVIMNNLVKSADDSDFPQMHLSVLVDDNHMESPYHYASEDLTIVFVNPYKPSKDNELADMQFVLQLEGGGAEFVGGGAIGCDGNQRVSARLRDEDGRVQLQIHDTSGSYKLWAGWAIGHNAVRLTPPLLLEPRPMGGNNAAPGRVKKKASKKKTTNDEAADAAIEADGPPVDTKPGLKGQAGVAKEHKKVSVETKRGSGKKYDGHKKAHQKRKKVKSPSADEEDDPEHIKEEPMEAAQKMDEIHRREVEANKKKRQPKRKLKREWADEDDEDDEDLAPLKDERKDERPVHGSTDQQKTLDEAQRRKDLAAEMERNFPDQRSFRFRYEKGVVLQTSSHVVACVFFVLSMGAFFLILDRRREKGRRDL